MFPSSNTQDLASAWAAMRTQAARVKATADALRGMSQVTRMQVLEYANRLALDLASLTTNAAVPGLAQYATGEMNNPSLDLAAEYTTMRAQIVATQDWIVTNFPKDGSGNLAVFSFTEGKMYADVNLTGPQLSAFKAQLANLSATIA
jgi:hypothetical protein